MQNQVLDARIDPPLNLLLDLVDRPGEIDGLDVIPRAFVREHGGHEPLLLGNRLGSLALLAQPAEVFVGDGEVAVTARRSLTTELVIDVAEVLDDLLGGGGGPSDPAIPA